MRSELVKLRLAVSVTVAPAAMVTLESWGEKSSYGPPELVPRGGRPARTTAGSVTELVPVFCSVPVAVNEEPTDTTLLDTEHCRLITTPVDARSEEHTSELQS